MWASSRLRRVQTALRCWRTCCSPRFNGRDTREACSRVLEHLATDYGIHLAIAEIDTRNQRSIALVESLGFVRTATRRAADYFNGASSDEYRYELSLPRDESAH